MNTHKAPQTRAEIIDRLAMALRGRHDLATRLATELLDRHDDGRELALDLVAALEDPDKVRDRINAALLAERFPDPAPAPELCEMGYVLQDDPHLWVAKCPRTGEVVAIADPRVISNPGRARHVHAPGTFPNVGTRTTTLEGETR